ncbi:hypothetical protein COCCADRAFT_22171 [Bipolaris zeicola 26-R-13]|uniref:Uncharacterized protein n=1 Tax=Cochliobolus carbonum (strain 26-R-13) TaxID=930089 RepID=W6YLB2_COCC2|nr:uncharacterized protein COCCADRAFT_22171 [Bipolaris zeicola 26-R-13]EUC38293.1 hypothetical protein COCCADRAFT_22171 [Bipolaris zeicola 26-R-13]
MNKRREPVSLTWVPLVGSAACLCATAYLARSLLTTKERYGPNLTANMIQGFCSHNQLLISRLPAYGATESSYSRLLHLFHEPHASVYVYNELLRREKASWESVPDTVQLLSIEGKRGTSIPGVPISRTTLIALLLLTNARVIHEFSSSSGYRAALGSWCGQWYIQWEMGQQHALVSLRAHDSHSPATDVYAPVFSARVDACVKMMAGVVQHPSGGPNLFAVAFPGRMPAGEYYLQYQENGFALSHGARHIYNMNGGKVYEVDFLLPRKKEQDVFVISRTGQDEAEVILDLPSSKQEVHPVRMYIAPNEQAILAQCLDFLPWAYLSWSIHRGMRDILLAFSRKTMHEYRQRLAQQLRDAVPQHREVLVKQGWEPSFVDEHMGIMASSAILAERGNSGDAVRIVTALAALEHSGGYEPDLSDLDETTFWRRSVSERVTGTEEDGVDVERLSRDTVVALVKCFVLEWSVDFDYQFYHRLPIDLLFV